MNEWVCTNCGMSRMNVDFLFLDPKYGNARCARCRGLRTFKRNESAVAVARSTDPITSHMAAASVTGIRDSQEKVLSALRRHGPGTDEDIYEWLREDRVKISLSGARTRRSELVRLGLVIDTGEKKRLPSRRLSIVWRVNSAG